MTKFVGFEVAMRQMSIKTAAELQISTIFSADISSSTSGFALIFDVILKTDYHELVSNPYANYYIKKGVGLRVALCVTEVKANISGTFAAVAAEASLNNLSVQYKVDGLGLSKDVVKSLLCIPITGPLDSHAFQNIRKAISVDLPKYLSGTDIAPGWYSVPVPPEQDNPETIARGINYTISKVAQGTSLEKAIHDKPAGVAADLVTLIYARFSAGGKNGPGHAQREQAARWLTNGDTH